jgi:hypothetical protein
LVSVGRRPVTEGLNLDKIGVEVDNKGRIVIDDEYNTTVKGIKCIGDVTFGPMLAHKAEEEGTYAFSFLMLVTYICIQVSQPSRSLLKVTDMSTTAQFHLSSTPTLKLHGPERMSSS